MRASLLARGLLPLTTLLLSFGCGDTDTGGLGPSPDAGCRPASCPEGQVCTSEGRCGPCEDDQACPGGICVDGACTPGTRCTSDPDCAEGEVCDEGRCAAASLCDAETPCPSGLVCDEADRRCRPCDSDWECADGQICNEARRCETGLPCERTDDCPETLRCSRGLCRRPCSDDAACGPPMGFFVCIRPEAECRQRCTASRQCRPGRYCSDDRVCAPSECEVDGDCPSSQVCRGAEDGRGRCVAIQLCESDADCPSDQTCNPRSGECEPAAPCRTDRDCGGAALCDASGRCRFATPCAGPASCPAGLDCVAGLCVPAVCRGDADCAGPERCVAGRCQPPGSPNAVVEVRILTPDRAVYAGDTVQLVALGLDQAGRAVPALAFDWAVAEGTPAGVLTVDGDGLATAGPTPGTAEVTASVDGPIGPVRSSPIILTHLGARPTSTVSLEVRVTDRVSGRPFTGASVRLDDTGAAAVTDAEGWARFPTVESEPFGVTVSHPDRDWVTVQGVGPGALGVSLAPRRMPTEAAGASGTVDLSQVRTTGGLELGVAGLSFGSPLIDFDATGLFGGEVHQLEVPMVGSVPLPASFTLAVGFQGTAFPLSDRWYARSQTGLRAVWAFGGRVELDAGGIGLGDLGNIQAAILPFFQRFEHAVQPSRVLLPAATVPDRGDVDGDGDTAEARPDWANLPTVDLAPSVSQSLRYQVRVGNLPFVQGGNANALFVVAGVRLPGVGFVPLGIDGQSDDMASGIVSEFLTRMAPPHGGLEVGRYVVLASAVRLAGADLPGPGSTRVFEGARLPARVDLGTDWLDAPTGARWQPRNRTIRLVDASGDLLRVRFSSAEGGWELLAPVSRMVSVPAPPTGATDRATGTVTVDQIELAAGASPVRFDPSRPAPVGLDPLTRGYARAEVVAE